MKNIIYGTAATLIAVAMTASCSKPVEATPEPNFPDQDSYVINLEAGDANTIELRISPNQDWRVSIPSAASNLWALKNGNRNVLSVGGSAGDHVVEVECLATEQDLEPHSVEVSMTMGDRTQVIADITLLSGEVILNIRPAVTATSGNYEYFVAAENADFAYTYPAEAPEFGTPIEMLWSASRNGYVAYIQVEANFNWNLEAGNLDISRVENSSSNAALTELEIFCSSLNYPAADARTDTFVLTSSVSGHERNTVSMSIPPFTPVLEIRVPQYDENEKNYIIPNSENSSEDYPYNWLYSADPIADATTIDMKWRPSASATAMDTYILVKSNFSLQFASAPQWLTVGAATLQEETSTDFEFENVYRLSVESGDLALDGDSGEIALGLGEYTQKFTVNYDAISSLFYVVNPPSFSFATDGTYQPSSELGMSTSTNATVDITSAGDLEIVELELVNGAYSVDDAENGWISHSYSWNGGSTEMIQTNTLTVTVSANTGNYRRGLIMAFPKSVYQTLPSDLSELFDAESNVLEAYSDYVVAYLSQDRVAVDTGSISVAEGEFWAVEKARFDVLDSDPTGVTGLTSCYKLTYAMPVQGSNTVLGSSYLLLNSEVPVASYRVVNMDGSDYEGTPWVTLETTSSGYFVTMTPGSGALPADVCIILRNSDDRDFALIQCHYDPDAQISDISLKVVGTLPSGAAFSSLSVNDPQVSDLQAESFWLIEYSGTADTSIILEGFPAEVDSVYPSYNTQEWLTATFNTAQGRCTLNFKPSGKTAETPSTGRVFFYDANDQTPIVIICKLVE